MTDYLVYWTTINIHFRGKLSKDLVKINKGIFPKLNLDNKKKSKYDAIFMR